MKNVLTIAGSDSCAGAGIQADLKTFAAHGVYGLSVITAVTAQNTLGVTAVEELSPAVVAAQLDAVFQDVPIHAVKVGMLCSSEIIHVVSERLRSYSPPHIVVDPVMVSTSGRRLLEEAAVRTLELELFPLTEILTPNLPEAQALTGIRVEDTAAAGLACRALSKYGIQAILLKGGHLQGEPTDWLYESGSLIPFHEKRIASKNTHGTGCTLSAALASNLALGQPAAQAVDHAKAYITQAIRWGMDLGHGAGPVNHFWELYQKAGITYESE